MELEERQQTFTSEYFLAKIYSRLSEQEIDLIKNMKSNIKLYDDLADSLFPSIFGHS